VIFRKHFIQFAFLIVLTFAVYANSMENQFTNWDDDSLIVLNKQIRSLEFGNILKIFTSGGTYQPLRVLSYAVDYHFWKLNAFGYHLQNILLHAFASLFLYLTLLMIIPKIQTAESKIGNDAAYIALFTSILFITHPINCESVVWLSGRKYVLLAFFTFLSLYLYVKGTMDNKKVKKGYIIGSLICVISAAISSPFGIMTPILFLLVDYSKERSFNPYVCIKRNFKHYIVIIIPAIFLFLKLWNVLAAGSGGTKTAHFMGNPLNTLWTMTRVLFDYGRNLLFPFWLNNRYPDYISQTPFKLKIILVVIILCFLIFLISKQFRKGNKIIFFCISWFLIFWLPVSNIIPISTKMADRYIYIASIGLYFWGGWMIAYWTSHLEFTKKKLVRTIILIFVVFFFGTLTIQRNAVWKDSGTLWEDSLEKDPNSFLANNNLGVHLQYAEGDYKRAILHYQKAIKLNPDVSNPYENITACYISLKKYNLALSYTQKWVILDPENSKANYQMGMVLSSVGSYDKAIVFFQKALNKNQNDFRIYYSMALAYMSKKDIDKAKIYYDKVLEINPKHSSALNNLGNIFMAQDEYFKAEKYFLEAVYANKNNVNAYYNLGVICSILKKNQCAVENFSKVLKIDPKDAISHFLIGKEFISMGERNKGMDHIKKAITINPENNEFIKFYENIKNEQ
jgi:protein O-mannosyl-transferase